MQLADTARVVAVLRMHTVYMLTRHDTLVCTWTALGSAPTGSKTQLMSVGVSLFAGQSPLGGEVMLKPVTALKLIYSQAVHAHAMSEPVQSERNQGHDAGGNISLRAKRKRKLLHSMQSIRHASAAANGNLVCAGFPYRRMSPPSRALGSPRQWRVSP